MNNYEILQIEIGASKGEIKAAYKKLAVKYHPDKYQDQKTKDQATEIFKKINRAYEELQKGITGIKSPPNKSEVGFMSVKSMKLKYDGSAVFKFNLVNVKYLEWNGYIYPIDNRDFVGVFTLTKKQLKKVNYRVEIRFVALDGRYLEKIWKVKKPESLWKKSLKTAWNILK